VAIQPIWPFYSQNALIINFIFLKKKSKKEKRKNQKKKIAGVAEPPHRWWPATPFGLGIFWAFGPRGGRTTPRPLGVVRPPPDGWPGGGPTTPRPNGVAGHHLWGGSATPAIFFSFLDFFLNKIYDEGILGIKWPNGLNCHNLKVWGGRVSHFKL
jgi:hypothetical protein